LEIPDNAGKILDNEKGVLVNYSDKHYYTTLGATKSNPFQGVALEQLSEKQVENLMKFTDKTLKSTRALENILSVFTSVGDKFKDVQPSSETFMNSGQLQNALVDYMRVAAFSTKFGAVAGLVYKANGGPVNGPDACATGCAASAAAVGISASLAGSVSVCPRC
jgi:hypothetical protein